MTDEPQTPAEAEVLADEENAPEELAEQEPAPEEPAKTEYLEFVGMEPYGTEFYTKQVGAVGHSISDAHMKQTHDVSLGKKVIEWKRGANGRFMVPTSDISPEALEVLENDSMFKKVTL